MSGIEFVVSEHGKLLDKARTEAIADARRKAELYAAAAGMKVGRVMAISEEGATPHAAALSDAARRRGDPDRPGEQTLRARGHRQLRIDVVNQRLDLATGQP